MSRVCPARNAQVLYAAGTTYYRRDWITMDGDGDDLTVFVTQLPDKGQVRHCAVPAVWAWVCL